MNNLEGYFSKIDEKFDQLNARITALQDLVLYMKNEFELLSQTKIEKIGFGDLTDLTEKKLNQFIDERPKNCLLLDPCTTLIEKWVLRVLNIYAKKGPYPAINKINAYRKSIVKYKEMGKCSDGKCINKALQLFDSIKNLIDSDVEKNLDQSKKIIRKISKIRIKEGKEEDECKMLAPLSNEIRLKILKILNKGSTYYTQIERELGIKGGHFHFHLDKLIEAGYVMQEEDKGPYRISLKGIKALQFLYELHQEMISAT